MAAGILAGLAGKVLDTGVSQMEASQNFERSKYLQDRQHQYNVADLVGSHMANVQGMKLAGLNPALAQAGTYSPLANSLGNPEMARSAPTKLDPVVGAQIENMRVQNDLLREQVQAQKNKNQEWEDENIKVGEYGAVLAAKWQNSDWFDKLPPDTQDTINNLAENPEEMTIGGWNALERTIMTQKHLSEADKVQVQNAFDIAKLSSQFSKPEVWNSIVKEPLAKYNLTKEQIAGIEQTIKESKTKILDMLQDIELKKASEDEIYTNIKHIVENDVGILVKDGRYGKAAAKKLDDYTQDIVKALTGIIAAKVLGSSIKVPEPKKSDGPKIHTPTPKEQETIQLNKDLGESGVGQFRWNLY